MSTPASHERKPSNGTSIPRWAALILAPFVWFVAIPLVHGVAPWAISSFTPRYGWAQGHPGTWNLLGVIPLALGATLLIWVLVAGMVQTPKKVKLRLTPSFLMLRGPYAFTRNPMYVAEVGLWLGWAIFFGSIGVLVAAVVLSGVVNFAVVPREERGLEAIFGQSYLQYKSRTPRWLGMPRR
jgi:protein-S-isoprenylcysteine O-methyltransferase Ste14